MTDTAQATPITDRLRRLHPSDVFTYERFSDEGELIECGQSPIGLDAHCAADLIDQQQLSVEAISWIQSLARGGADVTVSMLPEHASFGFGGKFCVSIRTGFEAPRRLYGNSLESIYWMIRDQEPTHD